MEEEIKKLRKEISDIKSETNKFKRRVSIILNLFLPGIGFILYKGAYLKGGIAISITLGYDLLFFLKMSHNIDFTGLIIYYVLPMVILYFITTFFIIEGN